MLNLLLAAEELQGRFESLDGIEQRPPSYIAYLWIRDVLHDILTRAGYEATRTIDTEGRFIHGYSRRNGTHGCRNVGITVWDRELKMLRVSHQLLKSDRSFYPSPSLPAPEWTKEEVFPIGWPEEDCEKARAVLRLGRLWQEKVLQNGHDSKTARMARAKFWECGDYFLTLIHRYFDLPRPDPNSSFASEAERLSAALFDIESPTRFWSTAYLFAEVPTQKTWASMDDFKEAISELDAAVAAYRSSGQVVLDPVEKNP